MDKQFWVSISQKDYRIPEGYTQGELTDTLFGYLSSTDPELRDDIAYGVYVNWLQRAIYTKAEIGEHAQTLLTNLETGIGETETDSVFLRAFSVLFLAELVHNDNKNPVLDKEQVESILAKALWYLNAEKDPRGHVTVKGWAHALAHTADLMLELAKNRFVERKGLEEILQAISDKLTHSTDWVYIHGEDDRLAKAVIEILRRDLIPLEEVAAWTQSFLETDGQPWNGVYVDERRNRAFQNTRNLLRSLYLRLVSMPGDLPKHEGLTHYFLKTLNELKP